MKVLVQAIESGGQVKPDELFCKGTKIESADWHVEMGCWSSFPTTSTLGFTGHAYEPEVNQTIAKHRVGQDLYITLFLFRPPGFSRVFSDVCNKQLAFALLCCDTGSDVHEPRVFQIRSSRQPMRWDGPIRTANGII